MHIPEEILTADFLPEVASVGVPVVFHPIKINLDDWPEISWAGELKVGATSAVGFCFQSKSFGVA